MGFLLAAALLMREAGELVARGRFMCGEGACIISSSSFILGFLDLANCGDDDLSGSLYAC